MRYTRLLIGTLVTVGLLAGLVVSPAYADPPFDPGLERAIAVQEYHTNSLMAKSGVVGTAVGLGADGQLVVKIYTESAAVAGLPRSLDGVPVEVVVTGKFFALDKPPHSHPTGGDNGDAEPTDPTDRFPRPVPIGVSTGNTGECSAGTIGARVTDGMDVYALSNNHVYALENEAPLGSDILQPGRFDTNCKKKKNNVIGTLFAFVPIGFINFATEDIPENVADAAIALSSLGDLANATPSDGYGRPKSATFVVTVSDLPLAVQKYGRTSALTSGTITGVNAMVDVAYPVNPVLIRVARFVNQIMVDTGIEAGDSGSLLVVNGGDHDRKPVGLLFAGSETVAVANPIDLVLDGLAEELLLPPGTITIDGE